MIKLERNRSLDTVTAGLRGAARVDKALLLLRGKLSGNNLEFNSAFWKAAKKQLKAESNGKCAYCEAPTATVAHGDVEHFRPKSTYWWLAYCYDNYLFSCQICNQSFKGDNFPHDGTQMNLETPLPALMTEAEILALAPFLAPDPLNDAEGHPMSKFITAVKKEKAGLVDPYMVDPEPLFKWVAEPVLKEVRLAARNNTVAAKRAFRAVDEFLGLNRPELVGLRWKTFKTLETFKRSLLSPAINTDPELRDEIVSQIKEMMSNTAQFAGMARHFIRREWNDELENFDFG
jgi:hypothetical protein